MSRPRSEEKRQAILDAALRVFAERGIAHAPTWAISKAAGVAEGSLFTYFGSKDELIAELYRELRQDFSRHLDGLPDEEDARTRLKFIWDKYLELGRTHPERLKVLSQLRASGTLFKENEEPTFAFREILRATHEVTKGKELHGAPPEYLVLIMRAHAEMTMEFINAHPESAEMCRETGFRILWNGLTASENHSVLMSEESFNK
jgi:AcrR family transcriptional regulator